MKNEERYNHLNKYLKEKFGERTLKICIDGSFTCPNRDGSKDTNGCIFCSKEGSGELINKNDFICVEDSIKDQVLTFLSSYRGQRANKFIAYFQNFTNTYDTIDNLKKKYDSALISPKIVGLEVATRPDCIDNDICKLLASYTNKYFVTVELGLQTSNENTGMLINRKYSNTDFIKSVSMLKAHSIEVVCHLMIGLPGEDIHDLENSINFINELPIDGVKFHSTYVVKDTKLNDMYIKNKYTPLTLTEYLDDLTFAITHLRKDIIIHRISGDAPENILIAPEWNTHKKKVLNGLDKILREKNLYQGIYYKK